MKTVGFIGLGNMGAAMAVNLRKAGYALVVHDLRAVLDAPSNAAYALPLVYQRKASAIGIAHSRPWTPASWVSRGTEDQSPSSGW